MQFKINRATPDDFKLIADLGAQTFYDTWRPVNTEEDMQAYIAKSFDYNLIMQDIENTAVNTFLIAFDGDKPIGYAKLRCDRYYDQFNNESALELERIYVLKEWQEKKAGKALMDVALDFAREKNYKWFWLGVNIDNVKAINFYKKYNFVIFGEKAFQLGDAIDNDYLMKLNLNDQ